MPKTRLKKVVHLEANFFGQKYDFLLPDLPTGRKKRPRLRPRTSLLKISRQRWDREFYEMIFGDRDKTKTRNLTNFSTFWDRDDTFFQAFKACNTFQIHCSIVFVSVSRIFSSMFDPCITLAMLWDGRWQDWPFMELGKFIHLRDVKVLTVPGFMETKSSNYSNRDIFKAMKSLAV